MSSSFQNLHGIVIGLGSIGNRHLNNLVGLGVGRMSVVRRANSENSQFQPPEHVTVYHTLPDAFASNPDFAIICNPSHLHAVTAMECLDAGLHVLIEKPLGKVVGEDELRLAKLADKSDKICAMAYCMRYHPAYRLAFEAIREQQIGNCLYAKAWFEGYLPDWHPWEDYKQSYAAKSDQGGGVLRTLDHELDFMNWVLGPAESASGIATNTNGIGIEADDLAIYSLRHPNEISSQITTSFCRKPQSRGFEFVGDKGVLSFRMEDGFVEQCLHGEQGRSRLLDLSSYDINDMYRELINDFVSAIENGIVSDRMALLEEGVRSLRMIEMIDLQTHRLSDDITDTAPTPLKRGSVKK